MSVSLGFLILEDGLCRPIALNAESLPIYQSLEKAFGLINQFIEIEYTDFHLPSAQVIQELTEGKHFTLSEKTKFCQSFPELLASYEKVIAYRTLQFNLGILPVVEPPKSIELQTAKNLGIQVPDLSRYKFDFEPKGGHNVEFGSSDKPEEKLKDDLEEKIKTLVSSEDLEKNFKPPHVVPNGDDFFSFIGHDNSNQNIKRYLPVQSVSKYDEVNSRLKELQKERDAPIPVQSASKYEDSRLTDTTIPLNEPDAYECLTTLKYSLLTPEMKKQMWEDRIALHKYKEENKNHCQLCWHPASNQLLVLPVLEYPYWSDPIWMAHFVPIFSEPIVSQPYLAQLHLAYFKKIADLNHALSFISREPCKEFTQKIFDFLLFESFSRTDTDACIEKEECLQEFRKESDDFLEIAEIKCYLQRAGFVLKRKGLQFFYQGISKSKKNDFPVALPASSSSNKPALTHNRAGKNVPPSKNEKNVFTITGAITGARTFVYTHQPKNPAWEALWKKIKAHPATYTYVMSHRAKKLAAWKASVADKSGFPPYLSKNPKSLNSFKYINLNQLKRIAFQQQQQQQQQQQHPSNAIESPLAEPIKTETKIPFEEQENEISPEKEEETMTPPEKTEEIVETEKEWTIDELVATFDVNRKAMEFLTPENRRIYARGLLKRQQKSAPVNKLKAEISTYLEEKKKEKELKYFGFYEHLLKSLDNHHTTCENIQTEFDFRRNLDELWIKTHRHLPEEKSILKEIGNLHLQLNLYALPDLSQIEQEIEALIRDKEYLMVFQEMLGP